MVGGSYGGGIQLVTAGFDNRVDVIVPGIAWNSLVDSLYPRARVQDLLLVTATPCLGPSRAPGSTRRSTAGSSSARALGILTPGQQALLAASGPYFLTGEHQLSRRCSSRAPSMGCSPAAGVDQRGDAGPGGGHQDDLVLRWPRCCLTLTPDQLADQNEPLSKHPGLVGPAWTGHRHPEVPVCRPERPVVQADLLPYPTARLLYRSTPITTATAPAACWESFR